MRRVSPSVLEATLRHVAPAVRWDVRSRESDFAYAVIGTVPHRRGRRQVRIAYAKVDVSPFELDRYPALVIDLMARQLADDLADQLERMRLVGWRRVA